MVGDPIPKYRRRHFFINRAMQSRFIVGFSLAVFLGILLNLAVVYLLIDRELAAELYKIHIRVRTTSEIAWPVIWKLGVVTVPVIMIAAFFIGRYLTRRVEMPLVAFKEAVKETGKGDFTKTLESDKLESLPDAFNRMAESLSTDFRAMRDSAASLDEALKGFDAAGRTGGAAGKEALASALDAFTGARRRAATEVSRVRF